MLRERNVIRSEIQPTGDLAELIAHRNCGGELASQSNAGWDITAPEGTTIQVKARRNLPKARHYGFVTPDSEAVLYLFVIPEADYSNVICASEVDGVDVEGLGPPLGGKARPGSRRVSFRALDGFKGKRDVTSRAREAYGGILGAQGCIHPGGATEAFPRLRRSAANRGAHPARCEAQEREDTQVSVEAVDTREAVENTCLV